MHRSYVSKDWIDSFSLNNSDPLPKEVTERFLAVLRVKADELVAVFDGCGREITGKIVYDQAQRVAFLTEPLLTCHQALKPEIVLLQAAIEEQKICDTVRRGCEFGVDRFIVFDALNSERYCFRKIVSKEDRLNRIAQDACRQSGRYFIPTLSFEPNLEQLLREQGPCGLGVFGDLKESRLLTQVLPMRGNIEPRFVIVVGPEGGLAESECRVLTSYGYYGVQWAPFTLRTELACLAPLAIFHAFMGRA